MAAGVLEAQNSIVAAILPKAESQQTKYSIKGVFCSVCAHQTPTKLQQQKKLAEADVSSLLKPLLYLMLRHGQLEAQKSKKVARRWSHPDSLRRTRNKAGACGKGVQTPQLDSAIPI